MSPSLPTTRGQAKLHFCEPLGFRVGPWVKPSAGYLSFIASVNFLSCFLIHICFEKSSHFERLVHFILDIYMLVAEVRDASTTGQCFMVTQSVQKSSASSWRDGEWETYAKGMLGPATDNDLNCF